MLILARSDGSRIAIETSLISAIEEIKDGGVSIFCGTHRHSIGMTMDEIISEIEEYENAEENDPEPDGGLTVVENKTTEVKAA